MRNNELHVNGLSVTIQRGKHDKENPYVMISKKMIRDKELSLKSKGVLCYLLSMCDTWQAHPKQVAAALGVGKDQIYSILAELLKLGYAFKREIKNEKGRFGNVIYEFFEERLPESERFKEKSTVSGFPDTENPDTENPPIRNNNPKNEIHKEYITPPIPPLSENKNASEDAEKRIDFSPPAEVKQTADEMVVALKAGKETYKVPKSLSQWHVSIDHMIRLDGRSPKQIIAVFRWAIADNFWSAHMFKPNPAKYLREKFDQLEMKMNTKPPKKERTFAPCSDDEEAFRTMQKMNETAL